MPTDLDRTDEQRLVEFDEEMARLRQEVDPEDLTTWDMDIAIARAELEQELAAIDDRLEGELAAIDLEDEDEDATSALVRAIRAARRSARGRAPAATFSATVDFCAAGASCTTSGDVVRRMGIIWRAGRYLNQQFEMAGDELAAFARNFRGPIPITHGHPSAAGPLDGDFGQLEAVEATPDGGLIGFASIPRWLHEKLGDRPLRVSASWDRLTRTLRDLSLVNAPEIRDAELRGDFARSQPHPQRTAMSTETPTLSPRARAFMEATDRGRAALAAREQPASFSAGTAEAPAPAAPAFAYNPAFAISREMARHALGPEPVHPDDATEAAFLEAARRPDPAGLLAAIKARVATLERHPQADVDVAESNGIDWRAHVAAPAAELARLRCMAKALQGAKPGGAIRYTGPDATARLDAAGRILATASLHSSGRLKSGRRTLGDLVATARMRQNRLGAAGPDASAALESAARAFVASGVKDGAYQEGHRALLREAEARAERDAIAALLDGGALKAALSPLVARAVEGHGGRAALASDLADVLAARASEGPNQRRLAQLDESLAVYGAGPGSDPGPSGGPVASFLKQRAQILELIEKQRLSPPAEADPDRVELAGIASDLAAAGFTPDAPGGGRTVRALQDRYRELSAAIEARRVEAREAVESEAGRIVDGALAGSLGPLEELIATAGKSPKAFAPGLSKALAGVPLESLESIPCGAFANI